MRLATALLGVLVTAPVATAADEGPWEALETFRRNLAAASPFTAAFEQIYVPEGFSTGETESGSMALALPECLRWDYDEPYPKSFILCGDVIHYWNPGEDEGHMEEIDADREPGLDLLLLGIDELEERYEARLEKGPGRGVTIVLRPTEPNEYVAQATLELSRHLDRLLVLRYLDPEGNRTEFRISEYTPGVEHGRFNPPEGVEWLEEF